jgi:hypothetical protein
MIKRIVIPLAVATLLAGLALSPGARAQATQAQPQAAPAAPVKSLSSSLGVFVYSTKGQDATLQQRDEGECFAWAKQQSGIDPLAPPAQTPEQAGEAAKQAASEQTKGAGAKGAAAGAAGGAVAGVAIGAIAGDAGEGAAIGATAGAMRGARQARKAKKQAEKQAEQQAEQQAQAQQTKTRETFNKAFGACMDGRGYSVK